MIYEDVDEHNQSNSYNPRTTHRDEIQLTERSTTDRYHHKGNFETIETQRSTNRPLLSI
jgi:hypothetical protein